MEIVTVYEHHEEVVLHFGSEKHSINAYTLASTLVAIADAVKEANSIVNPGYNVEVVVEAVGKGSFRASVKAAYTGAKNLFTKSRLESVALGIITSFVYQHTLAPDNEIKVIVDDTQVILEESDRTIIIPRSVYEAQKEVEKSEKFRSRVGQVFESIEKDPDVTDFGFTKNMDDPEPKVKIPRDRFGLLSSVPVIDEPSREIVENADLQIKRAILERSKRKWEFVWRGITISAPVIDDNFFDKFFAHKITIAPGDSLEAKLKIYQSRDEDTGIYTNSRYEVIEVLKHVPRITQQDIDI